MSDTKKTFQCRCLLFLGVIITALGVFADMLGLGQSPIFGPKQIAAVVVGVVMIAFGLKGSNFCKCCPKQ